MDIPTVRSKHPGGCTTVNDSVATAKLASNWSLSLVREVSMTGENLLNQSAPTDLLLWSFSEKVPRLQGSTPSAACDTVLEHQRGLDH